MSRNCFHPVGGVNLNPMASHNVFSSDDEKSVQRYRERGTEKEIASLSGEGVRELRDMATIIEFLDCLELGSHLTTATAIRALGPCLQ